MLRINISFAFDAASTGADVGLILTDLAENIAEDVGRLGFTVTPPDTAIPIHRDEEHIGNWTIEND